MHQKHLNAMKEAEDKRKEMMRRVVDAFSKNPPKNDGGRRSISHIALLDNLKNKELIQSNKKSTSIVLKKLDISIFSVNPLRTVRKKPFSPSPRKIIYETSIFQVLRNHIVTYPTPINLTHS